MTSRIKFVILIVVILVLAVSGGLLLLNIFGMALVSENADLRVATTTYTTQEECEKTTGQECGLLMCDYVPEGKTFEEVCGIGFKKGWAPSMQPMEDDTVNVGWQEIETRNFIISLPPGWKFNQLQGIDSYVGEFVGEGMQLIFDYGWYSGDASQNNPSYQVTIETIDGLEARLYSSPAIKNAGVYFGNVDGSQVVQGLGTPNRLSLYGSGLTTEQQELALDIFRTIRFK